MKVLQINCVYKNGSTGKIVYDIHKGLLDREFDSIVCYGRGEKHKENNTYKCCWELYAKLNNLLSRITGIMYGGCLLSTLKLFRIINRERPDVVHVHCVNGYFVNIYKLITFLKKHNVCTVLTLHAEFMHTANCGYALECDRWRYGCGNCPRLKQETKSIFLDNTTLSWKKMKQAFSGFDENLVVASVSPWLQQRAQISPILSNKKHITIYNGLNTEIFRYVEDTSLRDSWNLNDKKVVFHATSGFSTDRNHIKGGYYVIEMAKRFWEIDKNVCFVVAGLHDKISDIPPNIIFLGRLMDQSELARWYSTADLTLITSRKETFSMIVAESLCCGTPVVGFEAGAPEMITIKEYSSFVPYGETDKLYHELVSYLYSKVIDRDKISAVSKKKFEKEKMIDSYQKVYTDLITNQYMGIKNG